MKSFSVMAGLSWAAETDAGTLTIGGFAEYGNGSYDTYNSFPGAAEVKGGGDTKYVGGGVLLRMDFKGAESGNFYLEASGRAGSIRNEYESPDIVDASGTRARYDSSSAYGGFHLGAGRIFNLSEKVSLDFYGKYFWTRQKGDRAVLSTGEIIEFEDADSSRARAGGRLWVKANDHISPYFGAAYEYEFGGAADAKIDGLAMRSPSMKGGTGVAELGLSIVPSKDFPLVFELGVQGYAGKMQGVTGSLMAKLRF
jgi:outer membrane autotransporter protein